MARLKLSAATLGTATQLFAAARDMCNPLSSPPRITRYMHHDVSPSTLCDHWRASTLANRRQHSTCISWPRHHTRGPRHFSLRLLPPPPHCLPASRSPQRLSSNLQGCSLYARMFATLSSLACSQHTRCCHNWPLRATRPPRLRPAATSDTRPASSPPPWPLPSYLQPFSPCFSLPSASHPHSASGPRVLHRDVRHPTALEREIPSPDVATLLKATQKHKRILESTQKHSKPAVKLLHIQTYLSRPKREKSALPNSTDSATNVSEQQHHPARHPRPVAGTRGLGYLHAAHSTSSCSAGSYGSSAKHARSAARRRDAQHGA